MAKDTIADFLVRLGFDGKEVMTGVAKTEAALKRLKKTRIDSVKIPKDKQMEGLARQTKQRIQAETHVQRIRDQYHRKEAVERRRQQAHLKRVLKKKAQIRRMEALNTAGMLPDRDVGRLRRRVTGATNVEQLREVEAQIRRTTKAHRQNTQQLQKQLSLSNAMKFSIKGMIDSVKNLARSWMSVFAVLAGSLAGLRFTQEFQAMEASFLAVSDSTAEAADNLEFIKETARTLPIDIQDASDAFKNMMAAGRADLGTQGVQELFTAVTEFGTALQVDKMRMQRAMMAIGQMLNKSQVMAEELNFRFLNWLIAGNP